MFGRLRFPLSCIVQWSKHEYWQNNRTRWNISSKTVNMTDICHLHISPLGYTLPKGVFLATFWLHSSTITYVLNVVLPTITNKRVDFCSLFDIFCFHIDTFLMFIKDFRLFFEKSCKNIWSVHKMPIYLHRQK